MPRGQQPGATSANGGVPRKRPRQSDASTPPPVPRNDTNGDGAESSRQKRAVTACRACRVRKVKCSNDRPTCAGCARLGCDCVYPEPVRCVPESNIPTDQSNAELGTILQEILRRLPPACDRNLDHEATLTPGSRDEFVEKISPCFDSASWNCRRLLTANDLGIGTSPSFTSLEHIFSWPLFHSNGGSRFKGVVLAVDHVTSQQDLCPPVNAAHSTDGPVFEVAEIPMLLRTFLRRVHIISPVMDSFTLLRYGQEVVELGPQWDANTCLVLVSAALGALATAFNPTPDTVESLSASSSAGEDIQAYQKAESYYAYARRRFGLLDRSLTACHCYFWSGIYLLYTNRPVQAWQSVHQASSLYTIYLKGKVAAQMMEGGRYNGDLDAYQCQLEQRLYWSCIKAESEICAEVELPRSTLHQVECSYPFPSPPAQTTSCTGSTSSPTIPSATGTTNEWHYSEAIYEQSWFYYLSEISLLRLSSRVNNAFYTKWPSSWMDVNLLDMLTATFDFEKQLQQWQDVLPPAISCFSASPDFATVTDLQLATWSRWASIKLRLYRPFLFRLLNWQNKDRALEISIRQLAEKAVSVSLDPLFTLGLRQRHAGTWFKCRETAVRALIILSARSIGVIGSMGVEDRAENMLRLCIAHLRYWEAEASDLRLARQVIEKMYLSENFRKRRYHTP